MDFNFGNIDTAMYGNVETDEELLAELMALEEEEKGGKARYGRTFQNSNFLKCSCSFSSSKILFNLN